MRMTSEFFGPNTRTRLFTMSRNTATDDWARHKDDIRRLYILENKPLLGEGGVIESMKEQFGFDKS